jgi:hypothetical protein
MQRLLTPRIVLSIIFLLWTTGGVSAFSLGLSGLGEARISAGQGFGPKLQYGGGGSIDTRFSALPWLDIAVSFSLSGMAPSDISGGFTYRGFGAGDLSVAGQGRAVLGRWKGFGTLSAGGGLGMAGVIAAYQYTAVYFFYPEVRAEAFLDYAPAFLPGFGLRLSLPLAMQLRRDMDYSFSARFSLGVSYTFEDRK